MVSEWMGKVSWIKVIKELGLPIAIVIWLAVCVVQPIMSDHLKTSATLRDQIPVQTETMRTVAEAQKQVTQSQNQVVITQKVLANNQTEMLKMVGQTAEQQAQVLKNHDILLKGEQDRNLQLDHIKSFECSVEEQHTMQNKTHFDQLDLLHKIDKKIPEPKNSMPN